MEKIRFWFEISKNWELENRFLNVWNNNASRINIFRFSIFFQNCTSMKHTNRFRDDSKRPSNSKFPWPNWSSKISPDGFLAPSSQTIIWYSKFSIEHRNSGCEWHPPRILPLANRKFSSKESASHHANRDASAQRRPPAGPKNFKEMPSASTNR